MGDTRVDVSTRTNGQTESCTPKSSMLTQVATKTTLDTADMQSFINYRTTDCRYQILFANGRQHPKIMDRVWAALASLFGSLEGVDRDKFSFLVSELCSLPSLIPCLRNIFTRA